MFPVRCYTCGKVLGNKEEIFKQKQDEGKSNPEIFKELRITRYCCKRIMTTSIDYTKYKL